MADYGEAKPAPETLSMLLGKYLGEGAEAVGSLFPPSNPYGQAVKNLLLGDVPETARRLEEGEPYVLMDTRAGRQLIKPEALEVAGFLPVGEVAKGAGMVAKGVPALHAIGAIKAPGGNWLQDQLDRALFEMKGEVLDPELKPHQIVSDWVDQKLKKYIRNEMGTEQDPLRELAERGITFMDPLEETGRSSLQRYIPVFRKGEGFPPEGYGKSELAKDWELITDSRIGIDKAGDLIGLPSMDPSKKEASEIAELVNHYGGEEQALDVLHRTLVDMRARFPHAHKATQGVVENKIDAIKSGEYKNAMMENEYPWLTKVPPETRVYYPSSGRTLLEDTGLKNLTQSLAKYGLMEDLRRKGEFEMPELAFKYEDLAKMTVPQTVEKMNELRAIEDQLKIKRSLAAANNAATVPVKEYPDSGFKWVQYRVPEGENSEELLQKALGAEGEMMKHCVGSYCREVTAGAKNIYSLRDPKGQPHVTIEVVPDPQGKSAPSIQQIKGATNAPPHERYIPYVQDFIKSMGDWKKIDDLRNAKMFQVREGNLWPNREPMPPGYYTIDEIKELSKQQNMPEDQLSEYFKELEAMVRSRHYAEGGSVQTSDYDPAKVDALVSEVLAMKEGGDVAAQAREKAAAAWEGLKQMYEEAKDKAASENVLEGLKGTARAYTTDVLGMPADMLASFPVAPRESGNPYANAIRDLQEKVGDVAGSDWLAQKLGLYGEGLAHEAGRMFGPGAVRVFAPEKAVSKIFAGERAATADLEAKKLAEKMLEEGAAPEDVWAKTGWGKGPEGKWRFEIPDWEARTLEDEYTDYVKDNVSNRLPFYKSVSQVFEHPELASAYPDVSNMDIVLKADKKGGSLSQNIPEWATPTHPLAYTEIEAGYDPLTGAADKSVLLHELQHAVQQMEGSALGGSPKLFYQGPMRRKAKDILEDVGQTALNFRPTSARELTESLPNAIPEKLQEALQKYGFNNEDELKKYLDYEDMLRTPFGQYQRLAGEAEARLTQAREKMSPGMRRVTYPWNPQYFREQTGVPLEDLIYRYENEGPSELITYHGTPHRFPATERNPLGEFDASKIGTGEGAQSYGHGIYLAESPGVAKSYQINLTEGADPRAVVNEIIKTIGLNRDKALARAKSWDEFHEIRGTKNPLIESAHEIGTKEALKKELARFNETKALGEDENIIAKLKDALDSYDSSSDTFSDSGLAVLRHMDKLLPEPPKGSFYKVDLPDEMIDRMLDLNAPIGKQSKSIQDLAKNLFTDFGSNEPHVVVWDRPRHWSEFVDAPEDLPAALKTIQKITGDSKLQITPYGEYAMNKYTGEDLYELLAKKFEQEDEMWTKLGKTPEDVTNIYDAASQYLAKQGIPGNKYFDRASRDAGEGTRNFVIFPGEEKNLNILERKARGGAVDYDPEKIARLMAKVLE